MMEYIVEGFQKALHLILSGEENLYSIVFLSLMVSGVATFFSGLSGLLIATFLGRRQFPLQRTFEKVLFNMMSFPTVVIGLVVLLLISRSGPLGFLGLLYTPMSMIIAQMILTFPIVLGLSYQTVRSQAGKTIQLAKTLGASGWQSQLLILQEHRSSFAVNVMTAFSRAISEVGAVMIVGGNIKGYTRVMTTAISLNNSMGEYGVAIALGIILVLISFIVNSAIYSMTRNINEYYH